MFKLLKVSIVLLTLGLCSTEAFPQSDPLDSAYKPAIDTNTTHYPSNIWITDTMQKVRQDSGSPGPQHWGTFYGTQNEFVDFQVHVQANAGTIGALNVIAGNFVNARTGTTILASSTNIVVYREGYMNVTGQVTASGATFYNALGLYPDVLIPAKDPYWGQTTNAFPFSVKNGDNQSVWVDVLIPSTAPSGYYLGSVTVKNGTSPLTTMPVTIAVWQWPSGFMPSTTTLKTEMTGFGYSSLCINLYTGKAATTDASVCAGYPDGGGASDSAITKIWLDADVMMKDHRYGNGGRENIYPDAANFASYVSTVGPVLNGASCLHGGTVCSILPAAKLTTKSVQWTNAASSAIFSNFRRNFNSNGWGSTLYDYLCDEPPNGCSWSTLNSTATTRHSWLSPAVPELVTTDYVAADANGALNSIDWMIPLLSQLEPIGGRIQSLENYKTWLTGVNPSGATRIFGSYLSCSTSGTCTNGTPGNSNFTYPNYAVDGKPSAHRAQEWITYMHGATLELYFDADYCLLPANAATQCGYPSHPQDPWVNSYAFGGWGEGTLIYAGSTAVGTNSYMGAGVTIPIILPSIRLKCIRDGMQDYEYLYKLNAAGRSSLVTTQISRWITNSYTFETTGSGLQTARYILGTTLHQLTYPADGHASSLPSAPAGVTAVVH